jgi:hypothetical protein
MYPRRASYVGLTLAVAGLLSLAHAKDASAYCRTTTVSVPADFDPIDGCWNQGNVLWWRNACVGYSIQQNASKQVTLAQAEQAVATAFVQWTSTACAEDDAGQSRVSIDVRDEGPVECDLVQYNQDQPNQHVIIFHDTDWPYDDSSNTLALTTVTYDPDTGEIYDADMEINSTVSPIVVNVAPSDVPDDGYDFLSIVTHETGHFLGMAHSGDERATMFAHYQPGQTSMRDLTEDDINGICAIYPPNGDRTTSVGAPVPEDSCDPTPRHGFSTECAQPEQSSCVKSTIGGGGRDRVDGTLHDTRVAACALGFIALTLLGRRRAGRRRQDLPK